MKVTVCQSQPYRGSDEHAKERHFQLTREASRILRSREVTKCRATLRSVAVRFTSESNSSPIFHFGERIDVRSARRSLKRPNRARVLIAEGSHRARRTTMNALRLRSRYQVLRSQVCERTSSFRACTRSPYTTRRYVARVMLQRARFLRIARRILTFPPDVPHVRASRCERTTASHASEFHEKSEKLNVPRGEDAPPRDLLRRPPFLPPVPRPAETARRWRVRRQGRKLSENTYRLGVNFNNASSIIKLTAVPRPFVEKTTRERVWYSYSFFHEPGPTRARPEYGCPAKNEAGAVSLTIRKVFRTRRAFFPA